MSTSSLASPAIRAVGLRKSFGATVVLDGIDLAIPSGSVFAMLGPNGAGKTTIVRILSTLIPRDAGTVQVAGSDLDTDADGIRAAIGVTGQFSAVDDLLTGRENLLLMADLHHLDKTAKGPRVDTLLGQFDIVDAADKPAATYSGGMRRRLDLAMTLMGTPSVIFLDEPTTGLDPRSRRGMWQIIRELVAAGTTIFLTTQYLDEADELADRIALLDHGRIVAEGTATELKRRLSGGHVRLSFASPSDLDQAALAFPGSTRDDEGLSLEVPHDGGVASLRALLDRLDHAGLTADELSLHTPDLDDVFLALTGTSDERTAVR